MPRPAPLLRPPAAPSGGLLAALGAPLACVLLAGCGGSPAEGAAPAPTVTVTVTPAAPTPSPEEPGEDGEGGDREGRDVTGRAHDAGTVVDVQRPDGAAPVLVLDRYTVRGVDDAVLAREGVPVVSTGGRDRFSNQNTERTYLVPVDPGAVLVLNECSSSGGGTTSRPADLEEFLTTVEGTGVVVHLDYSDGRAVRAETDATC